MKKFEFLEHPADLKVRSFGKNLTEVFINAALGMMNFLYEDLDNIKTTREETIEIHGDDQESLLVNWLAEILYLSNTNYRAYVKYEIIEFGENKIVAHTSSGPAQAKDDIKAVTFHELEIKQQNNMWVATVVYDI